LHQTFNSKEWKVEIIRDDSDLDKKAYALEQILSNMHLTKRFVPTAIGAYDWLMAKWGQTAPDKLKGCKFMEATKENEEYGVVIHSVEHLHHEQFTIEMMAYQKEQNGLKNGSLNPDFFLKEEIKKNRSRLNADSYVGDLMKIVDATYFYKNGALIIPREAIQEKLELLRDHKKE